MPERPDDLHELDRLWNDLLAGQHDAAGYAVDPQMVDAVRAFHAMAAPVPASLARLDRAVHAAIDQHQTTAASHAAWQPLTPPTIAISANGAGKPAPLGIVRPAPRWPWPPVTPAALLTAALVLLALVGGLVARGGLPLLPHTPDQRAIMAARGGGGEDAPDAAPPIVEELWETRGGANLPLFNPFGVTVAPDGRLWVADGAHSQFQIFAPDGTFLESWGSPGADTGQFSFRASGDVAFDAAGNIYVADSNNFRIQKFSPDREFLTAWGTRGSAAGQFLHPAFITVGPDGMVYVTDDERDDIQRFDADGRFLNAIGGPGRGEGQLNGAGGVAIDRDGSVWVSDYNNNRIAQFAPDGRFLRAWGTAGNRAGELSLPNDIAFDAQGRIYVLESGAKRVQVFDRDFRSLMIFGREDLSPRTMLNNPTPARNAWFIFPAALALDGQGHIYVSDTMGNFVAAFRDVAPGQPAIVNEAAATPAPFTETTLLDITLPAATLGRQSGAVTPRLNWVFAHYSIEPGTQVHYPEACAAPDFVVDLVLRGAYTVKALGALQVTRHEAGGATAVEHVAAGQEVVLHAGDALRYHNLMGDQLAGFRNAGPEAVDLLEWQWLEDDCLNAVPAGMNLVWDTFPGSDVDNLPLPFDTSRPLTIRFRELDVPTGSDVPQEGPDGPGLLPPGFPGAEVAAAEQGRVSVTDTAPKEAFHPASSVTPPPGGVVSGASYLPAGSRRTVQSTGDTPLQLYAVTIFNPDATAPDVPETAPGGTPVG